MLMLYEYTFIYYAENMKFVIHISDDTSPPIGQNGAERYYTHIIK